MNEGVVVMHEWTQPPVEQLRSATGEYTLAVTLRQTGKSRIEKFASLEDATEQRDRIRRNDDLAFVFDPDGHLV